MNDTDFLKFCHDIDEQCYQVLNQAAQEYAGSDERFSNFQRLAISLKRNPRMSEITPADICAVYLAKHIDSIISGISLREDMQKRIIDAINYLKIMAAILSDAHARLIQEHMEPLL